MSQTAEGPSNATPAAPAQPSFESQLDSKLQSGGGSSLSSDVASRASSAYGTDMGAVRVHTDSQSASMAESKGFQAFSYGGDVFGKSSALDTSTDHGSHVMMHELAHVAQTGGQRAGGVHGKVEIGTATDSGDSLEVDADKGAATALAGGSYNVQRAPLAVRGFGATAKSKGDIVHENQTRQEAEKVGFSGDDAKMIYSGNWNRDMNQLLIPTVREKLQEKGGPLVFSAMDLMHTLHFGYPIGGGPGEGGKAPKPGSSPGMAGVKEFGTYDPVEHIDNPGGLTGADVNAQGSHAGSMSNAGGDKEVYAEIDQRYKDQFAAMKAGLKKGENEIANPDEKLDAFKVDESGIPVYMQASRTQLIKHLEDGLKQAQSGKPEDYNRALRYAGESLHIMQDYYAHSNFTEIAINILIDSKFSGNEVSKDGKGKSFVETLSLSQLEPALADPKQTQHHLNSFVHKKGKGGVDGNNMTTKGGKEVMATGTFTLEDTIHSLKEKLGIALAGLNPFEKGAGDKAAKLVTWLESNPTYFKFKPTDAAAWIGEKMNSVSGAVSKLGSGMNLGLKVHGKVAAATEKGWGHVKAGWHSMWGDDKQAAADIEAGNAKSDQTEAESAARQQAVTAFTHEWQATATSLQSGSLSSLLKFVTDTSAGLKLSKLAKMIPVVGDDAAKLVEEAVTAIKEFLREKLEAAFHACMLQLTAEINAALAAALGSSEVHDKTGASSMTQPTHTDIAKDFSADQNGTEDRFSIIEEVGEFFHRVGGAKKAGQTLVDKARARFDAVMSKKTGVIEGLKGAANDISQEINGPESEEGGHKHQQRHDGAWLAPLANALAHTSSNAILAAYKPQLEVAKTGKGYDMSAITSTVMNYYKHPADCQGLWQGPFMAVLNGQIANQTPEKGQEMALAIKKELARRMAKPPMEQADNDQHTTGGTNRHGENDKGDNNHGTNAPGHDDR
ncbi:MAG: DUF4157 domain-containing protein [Myxococcales bacterium]|nr:DUF4157 domain-containing protein [Myxococcales bacterium]